MTAFQFSVIVAEAPGQAEMRATLESVARAATRWRTEVIVVRPAGRPPLPKFGELVIRELPVPDAMLIPERWGAGIRAASAPHFGCLTTEFVVRETWADVLIAAVTGDVVGAAGTIALNPGAPAAAAAVHLVRFSGSLPGAADSARPVRDIPGDTAVYLRGAVAAYPDLLAEGFWEVEFHRRFAAAGQRLLQLAEPLSFFHPTRGVFATMALRYRHGHEFGATRVSRHGQAPIRIVAAAPAVPLVLLTRIVGRGMRATGGAWEAVRSFPALVLISGAWALGEAAGAWAARRR